MSKVILQERDILASKNPSVISFPVASKRSVPQSKLGTWKREREGDGLNDWVIKNEANKLV